MNNYQLIGQLINLVEEFENSHKNEAPLTLQNFTGFLNARVLAAHNEAAESDVRFGDQASETLQNAYQLDNNIARLFIYMSRYAKSYIKKTLQGTGLSSTEEFTCLAILLTHSSLSKTALLQLNLLEKTSGTEVINRLLASGLITQWDDELDKRSKRIAITTKGKELLYIVFSDMNHVGKMITGKLSLSEKFTLQYLLQRLENFHYEIYTSKSISDKLDILNWSES